MKGKTKQIVIVFFIGYIIFFIIGYLSENAQQKHIDENGKVINAETNDYNNYISDSYNFKLSRLNYASNKLSIGETGGNVSYQVDQKYEKIAIIAAVTYKFDEEQKKLMDFIKNAKALIQFEANSGLEGKRILRLGIGVHPNDFESLVDSLKTLGEIISFQSDIQDKTNEYKELNAKRKTLEKFKESLVALKAKSGKMPEMINLEEKILNIEEQLQSLGVNLGDYDEENEFCTIKCTLQEDIKKKPIIVKAVSKWIIVTGAIQWASLYYFVFILLTGLFFFAVFFVFKGIDSFKVLQTINKSLNQSSDKKINKEDKH
ncbi:MAG: DUF4349 domain-containing protein [Saprospiraceae bacterium]|nr:DUF4349 domain-containing protein [Saprospiraceae bacterium]